jgi:hypothetical protein
MARAPASLAPASVCRRSSTARGRAWTSGPTPPIAEPVGSSVLPGRFARRGPVCRNAKPGRSTAAARASTSSRTPRIAGAVGSRAPAGRSAWRAHAPVRRPPRCAALFAWICRRTWTTAAPATAAADPVRSAPRGSAPWGAGRVRCRAMAAASRPAATSSTVAGAASPAPAARRARAEAADARAACRCAPVAAWIPRPATPTAAGADSRAPEAPRAPAVSAHVSSGWRAMTSASTCR